MTYVDNNWRNTQCQIMTEPAWQRAAAKTVSKRKVDAAAKTSSVITEKETAPAAKTGKAKDTGITASTRVTRAAAATRRKKNESGLARTTRSIDGAMARE